MPVIVTLHDDLESSELPWNLTVGKPYVVLGIESDWYRLLDDRSEPVLFDPAQFRLLDNQIPSFWVTQPGDDGETYAYPLQWRQRAYFERWHDGDDKIQTHFWNTLKQLYPECLR